jgi:predicted GTPase
MSNENSNDNSNDNANENINETITENINETITENITFFLKEKDCNITNDDDAIQKMMEELNEHINATNLTTWIDDIEEDVNPFFNGALSLYKEHTIKDLLKICNYYGIEKNIKVLKSKKQQIIHALIYFESLPENFEIVEKRYRMWSCIAELLNDSKMKKYIIF